MRRRIIGYGVLALAVAIFTVLIDRTGAPSPGLFGGLVGAVAVALVLPEPPHVPSILTRAAQAVVGVVVAAGVDFEALGELGSAWPWVLTAITLTLVVSVLLGLLLTRKGASRETAAFASIAGGAASMTAIAQDFGADQRVVVVVQYFRVLLVLATLPIVVAQVFTPAAGVGAAAPEPDLRWLDAVFVLVAVSVGPLLGRLLRIPAPALLGAMGAGLALKAFGTFEDVHVPALLAAAAFLVIGVQAGIRFTPDTVAVLRRLFPPVLISSVLLIVFCAALSVPLARLTGTTALDAYLATSPGGLPVVLATASETADDLTFVSAVQVVRVIAIMLLVPIIAGLVRRYRHR